MKVLLSASAIFDLENIKRYYSEQAVAEIGESFDLAIFDCIERLKSLLDLGRVAPEFAENHIRELLHTPFRIVYLRGKTSIQVIRVWRSERLLKLSL